MAARWVRVGRGGWGGGLGGARVVGAGVGGDVGDDHRVRGGVGGLGASGSAGGRGCTRRVGRGWPCVGGRTGTSARRRRLPRWWRVGVVLGLAVGARWVGLGRDWVALWAALPMAGLWFSASALTDTVHVDRSPTGQALAAGLFAAAIAAALAAPPMALRWLRETSVLLAVAAGGALIYGLDATATQVTVVALGVAVASTVAVFAARRLAVTAVWVRPAWLLDAFALVAADVAAGWAGQGWLALALAVTSVTTTTFAVVSAGGVRRGLQAAGMVAAGGAWAAMCGWQELESGGGGVGVGVGGGWGRVGAGGGSAISRASVGTGWRGGPRSRWRVWRSRRAALTGHRSGRSFPDRSGVGCGLVGGGGGDRAERGAVGAGVVA